MGFQRLAVGIVEHQIGEIELHDAMQPRREFGKKPVQFPVRRDGFGYFEKRLILAVQKIRLLALDSGVFHGCKIICRWIANQDGKLSICSAAAMVAGVACRAFRVVGSIAGRDFGFEPCRTR